MHKTWPELPTLLVLGRHAREKRPEMAVEVFRRLKGGIPGLQIQFVGAGYEKPLAELQAEFGAEAVRVYPLTMNPELFYANSTLLLFTSAGEGQPLVVSEALACGLPVAMFDLGVENAQRGVVVEPDKTNLEGLIQRVREVVQNSSRLERLGAEGRQFILDNFNNARINGLWEEAVAAAYANRL